MKKILLIEDNADIRENTAEILELAGYEVISAENGKMGYELALTSNPDLILCDIMMPVLDGYGFLHLINRIEGLGDKPFIFLTAKTERTDFRKGMEMGADDYITKPFTDIELLSAIESRFKKVQSRHTSLANSLNELYKEVDPANGFSKLTTSTIVNTYKKKQRIYTEGNHPHNLYHLNSGKVKTFKTNDFGKELTLNLYNEGDFFGYGALLENTVYRETAEALEDAEVSMISRKDFEILLNTNKEVAQRFIKLLANNLSEKEDQLLALAYNSLRKRVADAIITLLKKYKQEDAAHFKIKISREDLAHIAGTTTESLIRTLSDFKNEHLVASEAGYIKVLNEEKLLSMLN